MFSDFWQHCMPETNRVTKLKYLTKENMSHKFVTQTNCLSKIKRTKCFKHLYKNSRNILLVTSFWVYTIKRTTDNQDKWGHVVIKNWWYWAWIIVNIKKRDTIRYHESSHRKIYTITYEIVIKKLNLNLTKPVDSTADFRKHKS